MEHGLFQNWFDYGLAGGLSLIVLFFLWKLGIILLRATQRAFDGQSRPIGSNSDIHKAVPKPGKTEDDDSSALRFHRRSLSVADHYFFSSVDNLISLKISSIRCGCDGRTMLLRAILTVYLTKWRDALRTFCLEESKLADFDSTNINNAVTLEARLNAVIVATTSNINSAWENLGVPPAAVHIFFRWHGALTEILLENSRKVASSPFFSTNRERLISLLTAHTVALSYTMNDARIVLKRMNGQLDGYVFNGQTIEAIDLHEDVGSDSPETSAATLAQRAAVRRSGEHRVDGRR